MKSKSLPPPSFLRRMIDLDTAISHRIYTLTQPILPYYFLKTLEISGDGFLFFPIILSLLLYPLAFSNNNTNSNNIFLINLLLGGILDLIVIGPLKHLIRRPRPVYNKNMFVSFSVDHWSFPSGHSSRVSMIATLFYLKSDFVKDVLVQLKYDLFVDYLMLIVIGWAATTSFSRVLLGRHFVFDVVVGVLLGVGEGMLVFWIFNYVALTSFFTKLKSWVRAVETTSCRNAG
ncbi:probable lipid phosphate phosphatase beta [Lycium barbarum]|uniref:probable lipid phosphate phosphatase beta n=1 Tax=Lycium barbarum TaxID=112863 RepID=UPI00293F3AB4|nr:probable lipid phosphate phosphatase beta [Lycium barbarum]